MKALSERLGTGVGTIYSYADSKDELMFLVAAEVLASVAIPEPTDDWEGWLRDLVWNVRDAFLPYPWMDNSVLSRPAWTEAASAIQGSVNDALKTAGIAPHGRARSAMALYYLATGVLLAEPSADRAQPRSRSVSSAIEIVIGGIRAELEAQRQR